MDGGNTYVAFILTPSFCTRFALNVLEELLTTFTSIVTLVVRDPNKPVAKQTDQRWSVEIEQRFGVEFTMHGLRRIYGQPLMNRGTGIETVSLALGLSSKMTTEKDYCRRSVDSARLEIVQAFAGTTSPSVNPPPIDRKERLTGYA
jgi:integrase